MKAREIAIKDVDILEDGDIDQKVEALAEVLDPVTKQLGNMTGMDYVQTMSQEALELYSEATAYWANEGNFTAYGSRNWGTKIPQKTDPKNAVKCAAQKGKCQCHVDSIIYYGLKDDDGKLDTSVNYAMGEADHSGYTFCKNEVFGDPLPGDKRKKYCFCDESVAMQDAAIAKCSEYDDWCFCEPGGTVIYGQPTKNGQTIDITQDHWDMDAPSDSYIYCKENLFGAKTKGGSCFCELPKPPKHNYCEMPKSGLKEVGCYEDNERNPDFEELLSTKLVGIEECTRLAFDSGYQYAGLQAGGKCSGSNLKIGKYGESSQCNYKCPNGKDTCGGKHENTVYKLDYQKDFLCSIDQKFDEIDLAGKVMFGNGGVLTNPSGDGEQFVWTPRVEGDPFNMTAVRSKSGTVKGFKVFSDNPYYKSGLTFITWYQEDNKKEMSANGVYFVGVDSYAIEKIEAIEVIVPPQKTPKQAGYSDDFGDGYFDGYAYYNAWYDVYYTDIYSYDTGALGYVPPADYVYYYMPEPKNYYVQNSALSGYNRGKPSYYQYLNTERSDYYDYTHAYYYGYDYGNVYIFGQDNYGYQDDYSDDYYYYAGYAGYSDDYYYDYYYYDSSYYDDFYYDSSYDDSYY